MEFDLNKKINYYFKQISDIPRGSRNEKVISDYVVEFAKAHGYDYIQDDVYNVIVNKPASKGYEDAEPVILQGHMDMVCEKNKDIEHDFFKDPIDLYVDEEGWLKAKGTTLGADDGTGIAYMLAILDDDTIAHPELQCVFTVMEEIGLFGAIALKKDYFHAKRYINLDSGGEVRTTVSSAGGARAEMKRKLNYEPCSDPIYCLQIRGLQGGHSGGLIHLERGNAIIIGARVAYKLNQIFKDFRLVDLNGGMKFNAIPREADITFSSKTDLSSLKEKAEEIFDQIKTELEFSDEGFKGQIVESESDKAISVKDSEEILEYLYVIPNGLQHRSMAIEGLTIASLNAGVIHVENDELIVSDLIRSAIASHGDEMIEKIEILSKHFNFNFELSDRYYGWNYEKNSPLREILRTVLKEKGIEMEERASHGGLECGIFKGMIPDLDIITYGPIAKGEHTPEEKLDLASFDRAYENLLEVLKRCK